MEEYLNRVLDFSSPSPIDLRVRAKTTKGWVYGWLVPQNNNFVIRDVKGEDHDFILETLSRFTGKFDIFQCEVYEYSLIKIDDNIGVVLYNEGWYISWENFVTTDLSPLFRAQLVGNYFDHKDLLC